jgi:hypothetical protein
MLFNTNITKYIEKSIYSLNNSKYVAGILMIVLNVLSKYISVKFTKVQEAYIKNLLGRQLLIFTVAFVASRDVIVALMLTLAFILFIDYLLNEESSCCIIPKYMQLKLREVEDSILLDNDADYPSNEDIRKAQKVLDAAKSLENKKRVEKNKHIYTMLYMN